MEYIDYPAGQAGPQEAADEIAASGAQEYNHVVAPPFSVDPSRPPPPPPPYLNTSSFPTPISCDIKPRLTKEQHDILEAHFQRNNKPNTNTKRTFAESLSVSLEKVNNWFQNRRAKLKQDVKKQQGTLNIYHGHSRSVSDSETSPSYLDPSSQYHTLMMQHLSAEPRASNGLGISHVQHSRNDVASPGVPFQSEETTSAPYPVYNGAVQCPQDAFGSDEGQNRLTMTQEQFDAEFRRSANIANTFGDFDDFGGDQATMNAFLADYTGDFKQQDMLTFPIGAPMTSYDSTIPSNNSAESLHIYPSNTQMQPYVGMSASTSEWSESRSSSIQSTMMQQHQAASSSQWQPGQSIPVDASQQQEEFRQVAARASHARISPNQPMQEPSLPWDDEALARRGSSASLIQSMGDVGIQTPPQHPDARFKSPAPPANIAARRQRPRPAALGLTAMRSQSHSGAVLPGSPSTVQPQQFHPTEQQLRRIRSSNWLGGVAHGRVMKSTPGSAQRSPLNYTFAEAMNSPHATRHASFQSNGSLAPPTPLSPKESTGMGEMQQAWQIPYNTGRHGSITETELEHIHSYQAMAGIPTNNWTSSPPHTPMYVHQRAQPRFNGQPSMENTPPQSAPASQTCFPATFSMGPPPMQQQMQAQPQPLPSQPVMQSRPMSVVPASQAPSQFINTSVPDQQFQLSHMASFAPVAQQFHMQASAAPAAVTPLHFANGVPMTNAEGRIEMIFPSAASFLQQQQQPDLTAPQYPQQPNMHTPPSYIPYLTSSAGNSPSSQTTSQSSSSNKSSSSAASELFVHEYSPPAAVKRAATPRKGPADTVPKNYEFTNVGPDHYEEKKGEGERKGMGLKVKGSVTGSSPASSIGTALTFGA